MCNGVRNRKGAAVTIQKPREEEGMTERTRLPNTAIVFSVDKKNRLDVNFVFFISLLIVAQHVSGNHVPIVRS